MTRTSFDFRKKIRLIFGVMLLLLKVLFSGMLLLLAVLLGIVGAVVSFLLGAVFISYIPLLSILAILVCFLISFGISWIVVAIIWRSSWTRLAHLMGLITTVGVILISSLTIFKPLVPSSEIIDPIISDSVDYWDLETGSRIAYLKISAENKTKKTPVIFLHGGPGAAVVSFKPITEVISTLSQNGYDVYFYDQVGGGLSGRLKDIREYRLSRHVADLDQIRNKINAEQIILIGESFGGALAAHYSAAHPENVKKMVLISPAELIAQEWDKNTSASIKDKATQKTLKKRGNIKDRATQETLKKSKKLIGSLRALFAFMLLEFNPDAAYKFLSEDKADTLATKFLSLLAGGAACNPKAFPENHNLLIGFWALLVPDELPEPANKAVKTKLESMTLPVLILRGECDYIKWEVTYEYKSLLRNATLLFLEGAGHMPFLEKPDLVLKSIRSFLLNEKLPLPPYTGDQPPGR
jgi:pimeloyl-ACP methyl ester carboxylesterase